MKFKIGAVMFDLDGTLLDSEKLYSKCWREAAKAHGYVMTKEMSLKLRSLDAQLAGQLFEMWYGEKELYTKVRQTRRELMDAVVKKDGIAPKAGAEQILKFLSDNQIKTYIVTATARQTAYKNLQRAGIHADGVTMISVTDVKRGKPCPDVYLYACKEAGVTPGDVIVVEDSPNGVKSAYEAGCKVIMVPDLSKPAKEMEEMLFQCEKDLYAVKELLLDAWQ